jgi:hypothetical protein
MHFIGAASQWTDLVVMDIVLVHNPALVAKPQQ